MYSQLIGFQHLHQTIQNQVTRKHMSFTQKLKSNKNLVRVLNDQKEIYQSIQFQRKMQYNRIRNNQKDIFHQSKWGQVTIKQIYFICLQHNFCKIIQRGQLITIYNQGRYKRQYFLKYCKQQIDIQSLIQIIVCEFHIACHKLNIYNQYAYIIDYCEFVRENFQFGYNRDVNQQRCLKVQQILKNK
ncbi:hypothetical protein ABPG74_004957 [Tetrahymena malaccensis]